MRKEQRGWITGLLSMACIIGFACQNQPLTPSDSGQDQALNQVITQKKVDKVPSPAGVDQRNFRTHLSGDEEVDPVETNAQGQAVFQVSPDGKSISYKLIVANINDVSMAHIHNAPAGANGPPVVWLYPSDGPPPQPIEGRTNGVLAQGSFTADNLTGPLDGDSIDDLIEMIQSGNAYVNVHTAKNPGGEIRGQIH